MSETGCCTTLQQTVFSMRRLARAREDSTLWVRGSRGPAKGTLAGSSSSSDSDSSTWPLPTNCGSNHGGARPSLLQWLACLYLTLLRPCAAADLVQIASTMVPAMNSSGSPSQEHSLINPSTQPHQVTCQPLSVSTCMDSSMVPWNTTRLPNLLQHGSQEEAEAALLHDFRPLLRSNCSRLLPAFLCAVYAPPCPHQGHIDQSTGRHQAPPSARHHHHRPPCRELCLAVRRSCDAIRRKFRLSWPDVAANCGRLPLSTATTSGNDAACVSVPLPALQIEVSNKHSAQSSLNNIPGCKCKKERKLGKKVYMSSSFDYAMKGTYQSTQGIKGGPMVITVRAEEVLKTSRVQIPNNTSLTLWVGKGCVCPRLIGGHKYIFLGYEDAVNKRLLFDHNSVAMSWKEGWRRLVDKWETRLQRKLARERRRRKRKRMGLQDKIFERRTLTHQDLKTHRREGRREGDRRVRGRHGGHRHPRPGS